MPIASPDPAPAILPAASGSPHRLGLIALSLLGLILLGAIGTRVHKIDFQSLWLDEFYSIDVAAGRGYWMAKLPQNQLVRFSDTPSHGSIRDVLASLVGANHPPLYYLILHGWMLEFGEGDSAVRAFSCVFSLLALVFLFDAVRTLHGTPNALWVSAVMAVAASQISFSQDARSYTMVLAFCLGACAALVRIERFGPSRMRSASLALAILAMLLTHYSAIPMLFVLALYTAIRLRGSNRQSALIAMALAAAIFAVSWGPVMWFQRHAMHTALAWQNSTDAAHNIRETLVRASKLPVLYFLTPTSGSMGFASLAGAFYIVPLLMIRRRPELLLWWLILVVGVGTLAVSDIQRGTQSLQYMRYSLPEAAAVFVLATIICADLKYLRHVVPAALVLGCVCALPETYLPWRDDLRAYVSDVDHRMAPSEPIVFFRTDPASFDDAPLCLSLRHYSDVDRLVMFVPGPTNSGIVHQFEPATTVWYVASGANAARDASKLLPGCHISSQDVIEPFAQATRLVLPQAAAAVPHNLPRGPS